MVCLELIRKDMIEHSCHILNILLDWRLVHFDIGIFRLAIKVLHVVNNLLLLLFRVELALGQQRRLQPDQIVHLFLLLMELLSSVLHVVLIIF